MLYNKLNSYGTTISDDLLGSKLLKAANLSSEHEKLAKATCELKYASMSEQLKKIFSDSKGISADSSSRLHADEINHTDHQKQQPIIAHSSGYRGHPSYRGKPCQYRGQSASSGPAPLPPSQKQWVPRPKLTFPKKGCNPVDTWGQVNRCSVCDSVNHWAPECLTTDVLEINCTMSYYSKVIMITQPYSKALLLNPGTMLF